MPGEDKEREAKVIFSFFCHATLNHCIEMLVTSLHLKRVYQAEQTEAKHIRWKMYVQFHLIYLPQ